MKSSSCACSYAYLIVISSAIMKAAHSIVPAAKAAFTAPQVIVPADSEASAAEANRTAATACHRITPANSSAGTHGGAAWIEAAFFTASKFFEAKVHVSGSFPAAFSPPKRLVRKTIENQAVQKTSSAIFRVKSFRSTRACYCGNDESRRGGTRGKRTLKWARATVAQSSRREKPPPAGN